MCLFTFLDRWDVEFIQLHPSIYLQPYIANISQASLGHTTLPTPHRTLNDSIQKFEACAQL